MPKFNGEFTLGNALSMLTTLIACGALVYHLSSALADLRGVDKLHDQRLTKTETALAINERDSRSFIEKMARIEANSEAQLRILQRLEALVYPRQQRGEATSVTPP